jgi:peptidoglycan/LPS O-acetylase OafA/YrhL
MAMILAFLAYTEVQLPFANVLLDLGGRSYGIYLVHGIVMEYVSRGLYHLAPWVLARQSLLQPALIVLGLGIPLALMALVSRSRWRGMYGFVFG